MTVFEPLLAALAGSGVRFVVVGGVAVVLHGHPRFTADLDVALDLGADNPRRALDALTAVGLVPLLPVDIGDFADAEVRTGWVADRHLVVFTLADPADPFRRVDIFAEDPIPFEDLWARAQLVTLGEISVRVASIEDLDHHEAGGGAGPGRGRRGGPRAAPGEAPMSVWDAGGWAGARQAQEDAWLATSPEQRLAWLEEAVAFARASTAAADDCQSPSDSPSAPGT